ncbi:reverse transcriptase [Plakobranchus ocellatus]|uniref:Reverse transcriptase n=1 Tax=Plakobranchus ocellatus TaxID=259542 RepID=A0AAV4BUU3_9GAST|nr:reverse transcriptase [Plakobranchus ocellatus]
MSAAVREAGVSDLDTLNPFAPENRDDVPRHPSSDKRHKINFPPASSGKQWEDLDSKIVLKIDPLLGKSTLEHKLTTFGDIVYQTCLDTFGAKQHQTKCPPQRNRRQLEMDTLRKQKRKLKKQIRAASSEETNGFLVIWRQLKARHSALSRAESVRKKRSQKRKNQERFIRDPFQCPNVLKKLHKILRSAWKNINISKEWMTAEGVYIPKEQDSRGINQFRPISLLNVEGKIFLSVMASRLTKYLTENGYLSKRVAFLGFPVAWNMQE